MTTQAIEATDVQYRITSTVSMNVEKMENDSVTHIVDNDCWRRVSWFLRERRVTMCIGSLQCNNPA